MANELINMELLNLNNDKVKAWVEKKIKEVGHLTIKKVEVLPETDIDPLCIYFVPAKKAGTYDEYMYIDGKWELIGSSDADLSDYYRKSEADDAIDTAIGEHNESELSHSDIRELIQYNADAIGDLSALKTTAKDSAVDAVNSVYDKQTKSITMSEDGVNMVFTKNDDTTVKFPLRSVIDETALLGLADVDADGITGGQYLKYDAENRKFVPETVDNESQYKASKAYTDKKIEEAGMPAPEAKDKLLMSTENAETSELEWSQVDKSEVGEVPLATTSTPGIVKPDGETITVDNDGTLHAAPANTFNAEDFSVDSANEVSLLPARRVYNGTRSAWDSLSVAEKTQYGATAFTDDEGGDFPLTSEAIQLISGVDANLARVIRYGKLVIIALDNLTATSSISEYTTIASGLPVPYTGASEAGRQVASGRITASTYLYVSAVGTLSVGVGGWDGSRGDGSIVYVTKD